MPRMVLILGFILAGLAQNECWGVAALPPIQRKRRDDTTTFLASPFFVALQVNEELPFQQFTPKASFDDDWVRVELPETAVSWSQQSHLKQCSLESCDIQVPCGFDWSVFASPSLAPYGFDWSASVSPSLAPCGFDWSRGEELSSKLDKPPYHLTSWKAGLDSISSGPRRTCLEIIEDHRQFFSWETAQPLILVTAISAVMANTNFDESFHRNYQSVKLPMDNGFVKTVKSFGDGRWTLPVYGSAMLMQWVLPEDSRLAPVGEWGDRTIRSFIVGAPAVYFLQQATGGSRPTEMGSDWSWFNDNNGISGHAFMGALPFMTAAEMTENRALKLGLYSASALCGWSRVNDGAHYFSQVVMGWSIAYLATRAVSRSNTRQQIQLIPVTSPNFIGGILEVRF